MKPVMTVTKTTTFETGELISLVTLRVQLMTRRDTLAKRNTCEWQTNAVGVRKLEGELMMLKLQVNALDRILEGVAP